MEQTAKDILKKASALVTLKDTLADLYPAQKVIITGEVKKLAAQNFSAALDLTRQLKDIKFIESDDEMKLVVSGKKFRYIFDIFVLVNSPSFS